MQIGFILLPQYSSLTYASCMEPLMICNEIAGAMLFKPYTVALTENSVVSSLGNPVTTHYSIADQPEADVWVVAGGSPSHHHCPNELLTFIQQLPADKIIAGLASGSYSLAQAGLLDGFRAVVHWTHHDVVLAAHKTVRLVAEPYCIDRNRLTCRGGASSLELMLAWLGQNQGKATAQAVMQYFEDERLGPSNSQLPREISSRMRIDQPKLAEALVLMENNIEEPLSTDDLAFHVQLSRRQLERLFKQHLNAVPSRYYLKMRLDAGRKILLESHESIAHIAQLCGFSSGAHFSNAFRNQFGLAPSEDRQLNRQIQSAR